MVGIRARAKLDDAPVEAHEVLNDINNMKRLSYFPRLSSPRLTVFLWATAAARCSTLTSPLGQESQLCSESATQRNRGMVLRKQGSDRMKCEKAVFVGSW